MHLTLLDALGLAGVLSVLIAYALTVAERIDPLRPAALLMNLCGALAILASLTAAFNLSAVAMEGSWALVSLSGLIRWARRR